MPIPKSPLKKPRWVNRLLTDLPLSSALKSLDALDLRDKIAIIGIAKRLEELFYPNDPIPLYLNKKSETLKIIQQLRNEAHRFGIEHHRNRRSKSALTTELENISGVG